MILERLSEIKLLKELLLKTIARLSEDGKSIKCLLCGKSAKLDKCERSAQGHIKYFNRVHSCTTKTTNLETSQVKFKDFFGPAEKRQKTNEKDSTEVLDHIIHRTALIKMMSEYLNS